MSQVVQFPNSRRAPQESSVVADREGVLYLATKDGNPFMSLFDGWLDFSFLFPDKRKG